MPETQRYKVSNSVTDLVACVIIAAASVGLALWVGSHYGWL